MSHVLIFVVLKILVCLFWIIFTGLHPDLDLKNMGFLFGPAPIRRTLPYLTGGKLLFRNRVKVMEVHYNMWWKNQARDKISHIPFPQHDAHLGLR